MESYKRTCRKSCSCGSPRSCRSSLRSDARCRHTLTAAFKAAGGGGPICCGSAWDPIACSPRFSRTRSRRNAGATACRCCRHERLAGALGRYNFIATPQRGGLGKLGDHGTLDPDKDAWFAISKPGARSGNSPARKPIARNVTLRRKYIAAMRWTTVKRFRMILMSLAL